MSTVVQVSEICIKKGLSENLPDALNEAELAFTTDSGQVFVGAPNFSDISWRRKGETYAQYPYGNIRLLTELDVARMISGDVALNVPLQTFNLPTTNNVTIDISTTSTHNKVAVSATNPMPMFYLPPSANTAKMDISIVNGTTNEIDLATLYIAAYKENGSDNMTVNISSVGNIPSGLTFYGSTDNINRVVNKNASVNGYANEAYDTSEKTGSVTISDVQIKLGYVNTNNVTYTVYASVVCWESSSSSSAPTPGLSGVIAVSSAYSNANVIYPKGEKGDTGQDGKSFPNDGTTPVDASTLTASSADIKTLVVDNAFNLLGEKYYVIPDMLSDSLNAEDKSVATAITNGMSIIHSSTSPPDTIFVSNGAHNFCNQIFFNSGRDGMYDGIGSLYLAMDIDLKGGKFNVGSGSGFYVENATGIQFSTEGASGTNYYQLSVDSENRLDLQVPAGGQMYSAGDVHFAGKTTIDTLDITTLETSFIEIGSAKIKQTTSLVNNMSQTSTTVSGVGALIGWNLVTNDQSVCLINMLGGYNSSGFKFITYGNGNTVNKDDYEVMFDSSGNIFAKGGITLGKGSPIILGDSSGTGSVTIQYNSSSEAVMITTSGIAIGNFSFPGNINAPSFTTSGSLSISDYSGNVPSTKWVKNYVESTKVNFSNDGTSNLYANNGSFSTLQVTGQTTLENVTAVTPVVDDNSNNVATTAFVQANVQNYLNNVALTDYMTTKDADNTFVSGKYGMAKTDYQVQGLYFSEEINSPVVVYTDKTGTINQITVIDTTFASNNFVSQTQLSALFPNNGTSSGSFATLTSKSLSVTGTSNLNVATATTPALTDISNRVATCSYVNQQYYISGLYGVQGNSSVYYGKGLYYDIATASPMFTYIDSASKENTIQLVTHSYLSGSYVTQSSLTAALASYTTSTQLSNYVNTSYLQANYVPLTAMASYVTLSNAQATYATKSDLSEYALLTDVNNEYLTNANFNSTISNYVTQTQLTNMQYVSTSALSSYVTSSTLNATLQNYATLSDLKAAVPNNPVTINDVKTYLTQNSYVTSSALTGYLSTTAASSTYITQTKFNSTISGYSTTAQIAKNYVAGAAATSDYDSVSSLYYDPTNDVVTFNYSGSTGTTTGEFNAPSKTYVDGKFVTKSTILPSSYAPWSAQVNFGGSPATLQVNQSGYYILGCVCYIWLDATITSMGNGSGNLTITSLPTNATGTFPFPLTISISKIFTTSISATVSNSVINVFGSNSTAITNSNVYVGSEIIISGSYPIYLGS